MMILNNEMKSTNFLLPHSILKGVCAKNKAELKSNFDSIATNFTNFLARKWLKSLFAQERRVHKIHFTTKTVNDFISNSSLKYCNT